MTPSDPWRTTRAQRKLHESQAKRRKKANGHGGARPGSGKAPMENRGEVRKSATTRLTAAERTCIEAWGEGRGLGFSEATKRGRRARRARHASPTCEPVTTAEPKHATAMEAEMERVPIASVFESLHEHLKQDAYRRVALPAHLLGSGRVRLPTGPLTPLDDRPSDHHVQALKYMITSWRAKKHADERPVCADCMCEDGHDAGCRLALKPPTLREWLGPENVAKLGEWADVLREQPVPVGCFERWEWRRDGDRWRLFYWRRCGSILIGLNQQQQWSRLAGTPAHAFDEALQMALFTRHPAVKPEPKMVTPWNGNDPEVP